MSMNMRMRSFAVLKSDTQTIEMMNSNPKLRELLPVMGIGVHTAFPIEVAIEIESGLQMSCIPLNVGLKGDVFGGKIPSEFIARRINQIIVHN